MRRNRQLLELKHTSGRRLLELLVSLLAQVVAFQCYKTAIKEQR